MWWETCLQSEDCSFGFNKVQESVPASKITYSINFQVRRVFLVNFSEGAGFPVVATTTCTLERVASITNILHGMGWHFSRHLSVQSKLRPALPIICALGLALTCFSSTVYSLYLSLLHSQVGHLLRPVCITQAQLWPSLPCLAQSLILILYITQLYTK